MNGREPYLTAAAQLLAESGCTIRKWRSGTTGGAYIEDPDWGIEVPEPRGPVSYATFAHEVGHQMLHRGVRSPRWRKEVEAWDYAIRTFERFELPRVDRAIDDAMVCLVWSAAKAIRRAKNPETMAETIADAIPDWSGITNATGRAKLAELFLDQAARRNGQDTVRSDVQTATKETR